MLSLPTIRRICVAVDAVAATIIAASLSKSRLKSDISIHNPDTVPTIAACHAAAMKKISETSSVPVSEPALVKIKKERDPEKLFQLFAANASNRLVVENRVAFEDTVSRLAGAGRHDLIELILEQHKELPQGRREGFVIRIIMLYGKARMADHALKTFNEMHLFRCRRTVKSFNAVLKVLCENQRLDDIHKLIGESVTGFGIILDVISYNIIIKCLCEGGDLNAAYMVMVNMEKDGIKPDVVTYTTLISAFYKFGRHEIGNGLWNRMLLKGCLPNLATFNVRVQFLINRNKAWEALSLMRKMDHLGIKVDELTYNLIIKGFSLHFGFDMAKRLFYSMHGRGYEPNHKIYQTMIHYLCKGGEFDFAFKLCMDSMEKNWYPNVDTIRSLLRGLVSISKDQNASKVMKLIQERRTTYSVDEMKTFQDILSGGMQLKPK